MCKDFNDVALVIEDGNDIKSHWLILAPSNSTLEIPFYVYPDVHLDGAVGGRLHPLRDSIVARQNL